MAISVVSKHAASGSLGVSEKEATKVVEELNNIHSGKVLGKEYNMQRKTRFATLVTLFCIFRSLTGAVFDVGLQNTNLS